MTAANRVKKIVETAIRMMDDGDWNPSLGGRWESEFADVSVEFTGPNRFCTKAAYRVVGKDVGVWVGSMNGASHKNVGKPNQHYTPSQLEREIELSKRSLESIVASGLGVDAHDSA